MSSPDPSENEQGSSNDYTDLQALTNQILTKVATSDARMLKLETDFDTLKTTQKYGLATTQGFFGAMWLVFGAWMILTTVLGLALREIGSTGSVTPMGIMPVFQKTFTIVILGLLFWSFWGWGFAFGDGGRFIGHGFFLDNLEAGTEAIPWLYQGAYCIAASIIAIAGMAERAHQRSVALFTILFVSWIYPVVARWGLSGEGWLKYTENGKVESSVGPPVILAGSSLCHLVGGLAALCGAIAVGPRDPQGPRAGNVKFVAGGTLATCVWWFFFNWGGELTADMGNSSGLVNMNLALCASVSALVVVALRVLQKATLEKLTTGFCNGVLAGLVAVTAGCFVLNPYESMCIGLVAGLLYHFTSLAMLKLKVDDPVEIFAVHGVSALWGILALGLFGKNGAFRGGGGGQFLTQFVALLVISAWAVLFSGTIFFVLQKCGKLRISEKEKSEAMEQMAGAMN